MYRAQAQKRSTRCGSPVQLIEARRRRNGPNQLLKAASDAALLLHVSRRLLTVEKRNPESLVNFGLSLNSAIISGEFHWRLLFPIDAQ